MVDTYGDRLLSHLWAKAFDEKDEHELIKLLNIKRSLYK